MDSLFREYAQNIRVFLAVETIVDPIEKNVIKTHLNPIPIKAIVTDILASQAVWKMPGIATEKTKEIIIEKKYKDLLEQSQKIEIDGDLFEGWRINGRLQYRVEGDYLRATIYTKKVS